MNTCPFLYLNRKWSPCYTRLSSGVPFSWIWSNSNSICAWEGMNNAENVTNETDVCLSRKSFHSDSYVFFHVLQHQKLDFICSYQASYYAAPGVGNPAHCRKTMSKKTNEMHWSLWRIWGMDLNPFASELPLKWMSTKNYR